MEAKAIAKFQRVSPRKTALIARNVRGKGIEEAMNILRFTPNKPAGAILNVLKSAAANAEFNFGMDVEKLKVVEAKADQGPSMKRFRPVSMGRAHAYVHRTSHITVTVAE